MASSLVDITAPGIEGSIPLTIVTLTHSSQEELKRNVAINIDRTDVVRFHTLPLLMARNQPLALVGGGPSVADNLDKIRGFSNIMTCGSAYQFLADNGITPSFAVIVDARENHVNDFTNLNDYTTYLVASQCHPGVFERLKGRKVCMWNFRGQLDDPALFNGEPQYSWGCMVGVIAMQVALLLGFQEWHMFGLDCSYLLDKHHAYEVPEHAEIEEQKKIFTVNGKNFVSTNGLVSQAEHIFDLFACDDGKFVKGYVYGDGLFANIVKASPPEMSEWLQAV